MELSTQANMMARETRMKTVVAVSVSQRVRGRTQGALRKVRIISIRVLTHQLPPTEALSARTAFAHTIQQHHRKRLTFRRK
jgi:hypothetical protein